MKFTHKHQIYRFSRGFQIGRCKETCYRFKNCRRWIIINRQIQILALLDFKRVSKRKERALTRWSKAGSSVRMKRSASQRNWGGSMDCVCGKARHGYRHPLVEESSWDSQRGQTTLRYYFSHLYISSCLWFSWNLILSSIIINICVCVPVRMQVHACLCGPGMGKK